ncbi:MAG: response regulator [Gemmatimonadales bacterium]|nr:response regulator [Gemmatimonadales bacterium]
MPATVLIVDDNLLNLELACEVLERAGYRVLTARDGEAGLEAALTTLPDLILLDIGLPGMDGHAVARLLKADERTRRIPAVALTAFAMASDQDKALAAGFDGYISKPIDVRTFPVTVGRFLEEARRAP